MQVIKGVLKGTATRIIMMKIIRIITLIWLLLNMNTNKHSRFPMSTHTHHTHVSSCLFKPPAALWLDNGVKRLSRGPRWVSAVMLSISVTPGWVPRVSELCLQPRDTRASRRTRGSIHLSRTTRSQYHPSLLLYPPLLLLALRVKFGFLFLSLSLAAR